MLKLSDLILRLSELRQELGDLPVFLDELDADAPDFIALSNLFPEDD